MKALEFTLDELTLINQVLKGRKFSHENKMSKIIQNENLKDINILN